MLDQNSSRVFWIIVLTILGAAFLIGVFTEHAKAQPVDTAIVFAADVSSSVNVEEYEMQKHGLAAAFRDPEVIAKITTGPIGSVAVMYIEWSGQANLGQQAIQVPWFRVSNKVEAEVFAAAVEASKRKFAGFTGLGAAMLFSFEQFNTLPYEAMKKVVDISGDGSDNVDWKLLDQAPLEAQRLGIIVNGLPILADEENLAEYYDTHVKSGPGAFILPAADYNDFVRAIRAKFVAEIS